ncbi:MAG TPA: TAXI family TRAP transporter solute-binding subunit [Casimicrobiaceae bacterium]|nr:TAXI family TRAP transporter solute-binding subunit [Casimicrobiaceae bacterium]
MGLAPRSLLRGAALVAALIVLAAVGAWFLESTIPRRIVLASGVADGLYHQYAQRYAKILARDGVTVVERATAGAAENAQLLADPKSGVDVAFMQAGVVPPADRDKFVMLAALYYEPLWVFYRGKATLTQLDELRYKKVAIGGAGQGVRAFLDPLLAANNVTGFNSELLPFTNVEALRALQAGSIDAAAFVGGLQAAAIFQALHDPGLKLMSLERADAYPRRFPYITKLVLPAGTVDLGLRVPPEDVNLIATDAMLVARPDLPAPIVNLLYEAAREVHSGQSYFEARHEFPNTDPEDLPVSADADRHHRFGPSFLQRTLPFSMASYVERLIVLLIPLVVIIVPTMNLVPQLLRWRVRSRIYRWYGELTLLERDVAARTGELPIDTWLSDLDRIEAAAARIKTPSSYASEAYTLREHISLVRRSVLAKAQAAT